jgi:hypothetical protein
MGGARLLVTSHRRLHAVRGLLLLGSTVFSTILVMRCAPESPPQPFAVVKPDSVASDSGSHIKVAMRKVNYHIDDDIVLELRFLKGEFVPQSKKPPVFEDPATYNLRIRSAAIAIDTLSLSGCSIAASWDTRAPRSATCTSGGSRRNRSAGENGGRLLHHTFQAFGERDGRIRLHPTDVKVLGISVEGLMKTFGMTSRSLST